MTLKKISLALGLSATFGLTSSLYAAEAKSSVLSISQTGHDRFFSVAFDKDGNFYAAGSVASSTEASSDSKAVVAKFLADGSLDTTFGESGYASFNFVAAGSGEVARSIAVDSQGRIVIGGALEHANAADPRDRDLFVARLSANGVLDASFGVNGLAIVDLSQGAVNGQSFTADGFGGLAVDSQDRIVLEGAQKRAEGFDTDFVVTRLSSDGTVDTSFAVNGKFSIDNKNLNASAKNPILLGDGSIIGTGYNRDGVNVPFVFKLTPEGALDTTYGEDGVFKSKVLGAVTEVYAGVLHGTDIVTVGYGKDLDSESLDFLSLRINSQGKLDQSYGTNGYTRVDVDGFNDNGRFLAALPDGRVALVGGGRYVATNVDGMIAILNEDGSADQNFAEGGMSLFEFGGENDFLWGAAVSPAGDKLVAVGIKGMTSTGANDDAALVIVPLSR